MLALGACEDRPLSWDVPKGTTGRQANQDALLCKQLSDPGAAGDLGGFMGAAVYERATQAYIACMKRNGYTPH